MGIYRRLLLKAVSGSLLAHEMCISGRRAMRGVVMSQAALDAAAERRRRKRKLRIDPPLSALQRNRDYARQQAQRNPNLPESINVLVGDRLSLHNRIQTLCRAGKLQEAIEGVKAAMFSRIRPTVFTCNSVLGALHRAGEHADVVFLFNFVKQSGVIPNLVTYNIVLSTHCEKLDMDASFNMLKTIYEAEMTPSNVTFNHLMKAHFRLQKYEEVMRLFWEMLEKCHGADPPTYAATIEGFCKGGAMKQAEELYMEMRRRGSIFSEPVFCNLIGGFFNEGEIQKALDVFDFIPEKLERTVMSYNAVMDGFCKAGQLQEALQYLDKLAESNLSPNAASYTILMNGYITQGKLQEAEKLFRSMTEKGCIPDACAYNTLLDAYFKEGMLAEAEKLFEEMVTERREPDSVTYTMLINEFSKRGKVEGALKIFTNMIEGGLKPDVSVYNKWFGLLCKEGKNDEAKKLFERMVDESQNPDVGTYEILTEGFGQQGRAEEAKELFRDILEKGNLSEDLVALLTGKLKEPNVVSEEKPKMEAVV